MIKRQKIIVVCSIVIVSLLYSCQTHDSRIEKALQLAKNNRQELEKVLAHYQNDSLKLEAAKFLIRNMPGHYSAKDTAVLSRYYNTIDSILNAMEGDDTGVIKDSLERMTNRYPEELKNDFVPDVEIMTADYLIKNIDTAFEQWQNEKWATHLNFDQFCEFLLPYKIRDLQFLDDWREYLQKPFGQKLEDLQYCELYKSSAIASTIVVNNNLRDELHPSIVPSTIYPVYRMSTKSRLTFGICDDYTEMATAVFRSNGIPVAWDFTPQWPFQAQGHTWNALLANNGKTIPFSGTGSNPDEPHRIYEHMAKVFRRTYAINPELENLQCVEQYIPYPFDSPFIKDVTSEYMECVDVNLKVNKKEGYAYLTVFNNRAWVPIAFTQIKGNRANFKDMGRNIVYLPVCFDNNGIQQPLGNPFLLTPKGEIEEFKADTLKKQSLTLYRKYPLLPHAHGAAWRITEGEFQVADNIKFRNAQLIHKVKEWGTRGKEIKVPDSLGTYQYWRYYQPEEGRFCNVAEIYFIEKDTHQFIEGAIIGTDGSWKGNNYDKTKAFDRNLLTFFDAPFSKGSWVGMDFGKPVNIEKFIYASRSDGNIIEIGDTYELFYWDNAWISLGKKDASTILLEYENVPVNALYWLRDLSKGQEERIFTYENQKQIWW